MMQPSVEPVATPVVAKILEWPTPPEWWHVEQGWTARDKWLWRKNVSRRLKQPVLALIAAEPGVEVANELEGTTQAIVTAPPEAWQRIMDPARSRLPLAEIEIHDDAEVSIPQPVGGPAPL